MLLVYGSDSLLPNICAVDAVGIGRRGANWEAAGGNVAAEGRPMKVGGDAPHVVLQDSATAGSRSLVRSLALGHRARLRESGKVDCLEDLAVEVARRLRLVRQTEHDEDAGESLTPMPIGRWRRFERRASSTGYELPSMMRFKFSTIVCVTSLSSSKSKTSSLVSPGSAIEARLQTATSFGLVCSMISVQRLDDWIMPTFCWLLLRLAALYRMYGLPVSICESSIWNHSACAFMVLRPRPAASYRHGALELVAVRRVQAGTLVRAE